MQKKGQFQLVNPFSEKFLETWELWKAFRQEEHDFKYKGVISEQMALKRLTTVSEGDEEKAVRIVEQSISRGWMDFYTLKQSNSNGERKKSTAKASEPSLREKVVNAVNNRYGSGKQEGDSDYLKAV